MANNLFYTVTIQQFKDYFTRDFPFLPVYSASAVYWKDDIVYSLVTESFYKSLIDNNKGNELNNTEYWQAVRGDINDYVTDADIQKAMTQAIVNANARFGENDAERINIYLHLIAYYLVIDLQNSSAGVSSSFNGVVQSKHVGDVSESYAIPQWVLNNPMYSLFAQNGYGLKYLSLISPYLAVTVLFSNGRSTYV